MLFMSCALPFKFEKDKIKNTDIETAASLLVSVFFTSIQVIVFIATAIANIV